jgi:hypothetical protein
VADQCPFAHLNGFEHLAVEQGFDLGYKFDSRDARVPFWSLYVSYEAREGATCRGTLHFDGRSTEDPSELLKLARPFVDAALRAIARGGEVPFTNAAEPLAV